MSARSEAAVDPQVRAVLEERARSYARPLDVAGPVRTFDAVCFTLGEEPYAIDAALVQRIAHLPPVTRLPGTLPHVAGLANVRGFLIPIVDLARLLGLATNGETPYVIVLGRDRFDIGILASEATGIEAMPTDAASAERGIRGVLVRRVVAGRALIDGTALLDDPRLVAGAPHASRFVTEESRE